MLARSLALRTGVAFLALTIPAFGFQLSADHPSTAPAGTGIYNGGGGPPFQYDDGSTENGLGLTAGGQMAWIHYFDAAPGGSVISHVDAAVGSAGGSNPPAGGALTVYVWDDPNNDGNPSDAVLLGTGSGVVTAPGTDTIVQYDLDAAVNVTGRFFVGAMTQHTAGTFPGPLDEGQSSNGRAWVVGDTGSNFDPTDLNNNDVAPVELDAIGFGAVWLLRAGGTTWVDLGNDLGGSALAGSGTTSGGQPVTISLSGAAANAMTTLVVGFSTINAGFKGGVMVPNTDIIASGLSTDGSGNMVLNGNWPTGLAPGRTLNFQCWINDASGPQGYTASNGLQGTSL